MATDGWRGSRRVARAAALGALVALAGCGGKEARRVPLDPRVDGPRAAMRDRCGVELLRLGLPAAGFLVELRFRVVDEALAAPLFAPGAPASLRNETTGQVLAVADGARARRLEPAGGPEAGREYALLAPNAQGLLRAGDRAAATLGPCEARGLTVEE